MFPNKTCLKTRLVSIMETSSKANFSSVAQEVGGRVGNCRPNFQQTMGIIPQLSFLVFLFTVNPLKFLRCSYPTVSSKCCLESKCVYILRIVIFGVFVNKIHMFQNEKCQCSKLKNLTIFKIIQWEDGTIVNEKEYGKEFGKKLCKKDNFIFKVIF